MHIITRKPLKEFAKKHPRVANAIGDWYRIVKRANYRTPHDLQQDFPKVSLLGSGIAIFNIGSCRLEVRMKYDHGRVYIRSIDTHEEYDRRNRARNR